MRFDLTDLRLFAAVVHGGSITRGAATMNLALAAASQRISGMEAALGIPLLERAARGVRPTQAGTALLRHAEDILLRTDRMLGDLHGFSEGKRGSVRLPSNTDALLDFLPRALRSFLLAHPGIDVEVEEHASTEIVRLVTEGAAELGIVSDAVDPGGLHLHRLGEDRLALVTAATHRLACRGHVEFAEVLQEPFVGFGYRAGAAPCRTRGTARHALGPSHPPAQRRRGRAHGRGRDRRRDPAGEHAGRAGRHGRAHRAVAEAWARRRLALCLRSPDDLTPHARLLVAYIREATASPG